MNAEQIMQEAQACREQIIQHRRHLHRCPGAGFDLAETVEYVRKQLTALGYDPQVCGKAGLTAQVGSGSPMILLRADMDALPMQEGAQVDFAAHNGRMHACGHDCHTAMLLGAAKLLKDQENQLQGTVKLMFQPAEEIFEGAADMIQHGVLEDPKPDAAMMIHVMAGMPLPTGTAIISAPGVSAPAADYFEIRVQGVGCHGSMPHAGVDALTAAAHILLALQEIPARELAPSDHAVLTIGQLHGGTASNVIADSAALGGTIRTFDETVRSKIKSRMTQIAQSVAAAFRASAEVIWGSGCPTLVNDSDLSQCVTGYLQELLGQEKALSAGQLQGDASRTSGSEDFAYVSQQIPSLMVALAAGNPQNGYPYPQHHPMVRFDEDALPVGTAIFAWSALRWLETH